MEKIFKLSKINNYPVKYTLDEFSTPIKINQNKYKEKILNTFLQDIQYQNNQKNKNNIPFNPRIKDSQSDKINYNKFIERKSKYDNINNPNPRNNNIHCINNNFSPISPYSGKKINYKNLKKDNNRKYIILNPFKERSSSSSKSILIPTNENQISILKNSEVLNISKLKMNNNSYIDNINDKKLKRNNTVYVKKHLSKEKILKNYNISGSKNKNDQKEKVNYLNRQKKINKEDSLEEYYYKSNKKSIPRINSSVSKNSNNNNFISNHAKTNTNNINSNVNIFNFDMQYNNAPNYFIKNSKMYNPYFNDYLENNINDDENKINNLNDLIHMKNKKSKNNYNKTIINLNNIDEKDKNNNKIKKKVYEESAIIIQSVYRGCLIRFQINNLLKAYKGIDTLTHFFKYYFWKYFKYNLIMKSNIFNNEIDSKMSISSISCISALFNSNNKNFIFKSFNSKLIKEVHVSNFTLNNINNYNNKYLDIFQDINNIKNNNKFIWNKKKVSKSYNSQKIIKNDNDKYSQILQDIKNKYLKIIIMKYSDNSKLILFKYFMKFYFNGLKINNDLKQKLIYILYKKEKSILNKYFNKFYYRGLLKFMNNHWYYMINGGRLIDINQNPFFIYELNKNDKNNDNRTNHNDKNNNNMKSILKKIRILKKILFQNKNIRKEEIKMYFDKFHLRGIIFYMKEELRKRIISKNLPLIDNKNNNNTIVAKKDKDNDNDNDGERNKQKIKILRRLINQNNKFCIKICKNIFDKWNLRTKIFSMIAIDKEKKKKRRIKKRNNKKLGSNNQNINNNNININTSNNSNIMNNTNKKIKNISTNSNKNKKIIKQNYFIDHSASVIFSNNIKINDYYKLNKFIEKINLIMTKKYFFFNLIYNEYKNKKNKENNEKNQINEEVDFFIEDSSDNSED